MKADRKCNQQRLRWISNRCIVFPTACRVSRRVVAVSTIRIRGKTCVEQKSCSPFTFFFRANYSREDGLRFPQQISSQFGDCLITSGGVDLKEDGFAKKGGFQFCFCGNPLNLAAHSIIRAGFVAQRSCSRYGAYSCWSRIGHLSWLGGYAFVGDDCAVSNHCSYLASHMNMRCSQTFFMQTTRKKRVTSWTVYLCQKAMRPFTEIELRPNVLR